MLNNLEVMDVFSFLNWCIQLSTMNLVFEWSTVDMRFFESQN